MTKRTISIKSAITATIVSLNLVIIGVFAAYNSSSFDLLAKKQSDRLLSLLYERTELYFQDFMNDAALFNELYCDQIIYNDNFSEQDLSTIEAYTYFITQKVENRHTQISTISYGDEKGRYIGFRVNPDRSINLMLKDKRTDDVLTIFSGHDTESEILSQIPNYRPQDRPWYAPAKLRPVTQWSEVYMNNDEKGDLAISVMTPVIHEKGFEGVVTTDISLNNISDFLKNDRKTENSLVYIVDRNHKLLLHSDNRIYNSRNSISENASDQDLVSALNIDNPIISNSMKLVVKNHHINNSFSFYANNNKYYGFVGELDKKSGFDYRVIIAIPENDLLPSIKADQLRSFMLALLVVLASTLISLIILSNIIKPIKAVTEAARKISLGNLSINIDEDSFTFYETYDLLTSFSLMAKELRDAFTLIRENEFLLESKVQETTMELEIAYKEILESEKLASLGALVAGVSHEISTPLGVALSASSYLNEQNDLLFQSIRQNQFTKEILGNYLDTTSESLDIINSNLIRAAELLGSFKQISVDQTGSIKTKFFLKEYLESIFFALKHEYKNKPFTYSINGDASLELYSFPGAFSQIYTNLIMNSIKHGLTEGQELFVDISFYKEDQTLTILYQDNGKGIARNEIKNIFDPFYTSKRNEGGSGLGLSIVYNIVTSNLSGSISCQSEINEGVLFTIKIPIDE